MKTVNPFSVLLFFTVLLSGCIREEIAQETGAAGRVLTVSYSFDTPQTRATATGAECEVKDVAIFFYNADDDVPANETYVGCQSANVPEGSGSSGSFPLPLPTTIVQGNKYKLIVIGNYNRYLPEGRSLTDYADLYKTRTYSQMKEEIQGQLASNAARVTNPLPFWGRLLGKNGNETTLTGPSLTDTNLGVSVKFSRAVARFDVMNLAADRLKIAWVKVCNYRNRGCFFHEFVSAGSIVRGTSASAPGMPLPSGYVAAPEPSGIPGSLRQNLNGGGLYAFANTVAYTSQDDKVTTCLMIAGYYQDPDAPEPNITKLTYYRANMGENGGSQILRRNYIYTLVINNVKKEGSDTEEGAVNEKEKLLDYVVGDDWDSDGGGTVTDGAGNFLTLSRTSIVLGSEKDESALIKVAVKKGTVWRVEWKNNADNAFRFEKVNNNSFSIITTRKNETVFTRNATLTVSVPGTTTVSLTVNVIQFSSVSDPQMLTVEGRVGSFNYTVPGQGASIALQVITGSPSSKWKAEANNNLDLFVSSYTETGANKGFVNIFFNANAGVKREGILTVKRLLPDGQVDASVDPVYVTFTQEKSTYMVNLIPNYSVSGLEINAFSPDPTVGTENTAVVNYRFNVLLADPDNYTFRATCSFNQKSDAFITLNKVDKKKTAGPFQNPENKDPSTIIGKHGDNIWLNVFRTGPGDADITGDITVVAVPKNGAGLPEGFYSLDVTIKSNCRIGDSRVGNVLWADRNVGATPRGIDGAAVGLNYTNDRVNADYVNNNFKGEYFTFAVAKGECENFGESNRYEGELAAGWRVPTHNNNTALLTRMCFSKQRAFIVSDDEVHTGKGTQYTGCWFPLSGYSITSTGLYAHYWSSTPDDGGRGHILHMTVRSASTPSTTQTYGCSVRCIRDIPPVPPSK